MQAFCVCFTFASMINDKDFVIKEPKHDHQKINVFVLAKNIDATKQYVQISLIFNNVLLRFVYEYVVLFFSTFIKCFEIEMVTTGWILKVNRM